MRWSPARPQQNSGDCLVQAATVGRQVVIETIKDYARRSGDVHLLQLLSKLDQPNAVPAAASPQSSVCKLPRRKNGTTPASYRQSIGSVAPPEVQTLGGSAALAGIPPTRDHRRTTEIAWRKSRTDGEGRRTQSRENRERSDRVSARRKCRGVSALGSGGCVTARSVMLADA